MKKNKKGGNEGKTAVGLLLGAAIGVGVGLLFAPQKGKRTRKKIKGKVTDAGHDVSNWLNHAKDDLAKTANDQKKAFDKKLDASISTLSHEAEEIITGLEKKLKDVKKKNAKLQK